MPSRIRLIVAILVGVATLELCARVDDRITYGAPIFGVYNIDTIYENDALGKRGRPNARYKKWQMNSLGYRGPEPVAGRPRIVCVGASETFGLFEPEGQEYPRQFEQDLNASSPTQPFDVVNVAIPGETISTVRLRVPEIADKLHPRFAIVYPSVANYIWLPWLQPASRPKTTAQPKFEFRIAENIRNLFKENTPRWLQTYLRQREIDKASVNFPPIDRVPDENVIRFRGDLVDLVQAFRERSVEPILVTHATAFGNHLSPDEHDLLVSWRKFYPMLKEEGFLDMERRMNEVIRDVAHQEQVQLVDAAAELPSGRTYFADAIHFTPTGAQRMGLLLAAHVQPLLQTSSPTIQAGARESDPARDGDLAARSHYSKLKTSSTERASSATASSQTAK